MKHRRSVVGFIDLIDLRFNTFRPETRPNYKAVIFCLMDVSSSMQKRKKDLAKRLFMLVHLFIERIYAETEIVFIQHTQKAEEVDEETFFYAQQTGGTIVSSALEKMRDISADRYLTDEWNIYGDRLLTGKTPLAIRQNVQIFSPHFCCLSLSIMRMLKSSLSAKKSC